MLRALQSLENFLFCHFAKKKFVDNFANILLISGSPNAKVEP